MMVKKHFIILPLLSHSFSEDFYCRTFQNYTKYIESFGEFHEPSLNCEVINENQSSHIFTHILWNISLELILDILILTP